MDKKKRNILVIVILIIMLAGAGSAGTVYYYFFSRQFNLSKTAYIYIDRDDNLDSIYSKIESTGHPKTMYGFKFQAERGNYGENIRTGRYAIRPEDNMRYLYRRLSMGYYTQMGYTKETLPALFIPNTYEVYWNMSADAFMKRMQKEHAAFWNKERRGKAANIGLSPEEVATLASIVEEETANNAEKPMVAGLYINRLNKGMLLQADPTVKFGLQEFGLKRILNKHLAVDSPYNTYKYAGLPPGPIRIPSIQGLESVLNYTHHNFIYMCAKEDFSGTHNFAATLSQHMANARRYQQELNKRRIK